MMFAAVPDIRIVGEAGDGAEALDQVQRHNRVQIALLAHDAGLSEEP
jgi:DNA-binding NarL/FixJ family response regulator